MIRATVDDRERVVNILTTAFQNDPHVKWLLCKCKKKDKLNYVMKYVVDEMLNRGEIYLSDCKTGVAVWKSEQREKFSFAYIKRNFKAFSFFDLGTLFRVMRSEYYVTKKYPNKKKFTHLYQIAVLPSSQGKGVASKLIRERISLLPKGENIYLETANPKNVAIYSKIGFVIYDEIEQDRITLRLMKYKW